MYPIVNEQYLYYGGTLKMKRPFICFVVIMGLNFLQCTWGNAGELPPPKTLDPVMAGFTKIIIKWMPVNGVASYKVYRNDKVVGVTDKTEYVDSNLKSGMAYFYKIAAVNADGESPAGKVLEVRTLQRLSGRDSGTIQKVVDNIEPDQVTAANLLETVQGAMKLLTTVNVGFTSIDPKLVKKMVDQEMELSKEPAPVPDDSKETLDDVMKQHFKGHSFLDLYIQSKLTELAEEHWQAGKKEAAVMLYQKSLNFLPDMEGMVFTTLVRIGYINFAHITLKSSPEEMLAAIREYEETLGRYRNFFPKANDVNSRNVKLFVAYRYQQCFPRLLSYNQYNQRIYDHVSAMVKKIHAGDDSAAAKQRIAMFAGWKMGKLRTGLYSPQGTPLKGFVTIKNVTIGEDATDCAVDERKLNLGGSDVIIPVYIGHTYELTASIPVLDGKPLRHTVQISARDYGKKLVFSQSMTPVIKRDARPNMPMEALFVLTQPQSPYNLASQIKENNKTVSLCWDWTNPSANYQLKEFKVYCDGEEIGTSNTTSLTNIKIKAENVEYTYTVAACDVNDKISPRSPPVNITLRPPEPLPSEGMPPEMMPADKTADASKTRVSNNTASNKSKLAKGKSGKSNRNKR